MESSIEDIDDFDNGNGDRRVGKKYERSNNTTGFNICHMEARILPKDEQHALVCKYQDCGDLNARERVFRSNFPLVKGQAGKYFMLNHGTIDFDDLVSAGNTGLLIATNNWDRTRGSSFITYAGWAIRSAILNFVREDRQTVKGITTQSRRYVFLTLSEVKRKLYRANGEEPTVQQIAAYMGVSAEDVKAVETVLRYPKSLSDPVSRDHEYLTLGDTLVSSEPEADAVLQKAELIDQVRKLTHKTAVTDKEIRIVNKKLLAEEPRSFSALGRDFGVSKSRIEQLTKRLRGRIEEKLRQEGYGPEDVT